MKVGDLVRFKNEVRGYNALLGTIIAKNGEGFDVLWNKEIRPPWPYINCRYIQTELPEFLEVVVV